jgi:DNA-binding NarL/FixJ family response regulator
MTCTTMAGGDHVPPRQEHRLLTLLVTGATQRKIARDLSLSLRSVEGRVASVRLTLDATTLYTIGVQAVRRHRGFGDTVVAHALHQHGGRWVTPDGRQSEILRLLAEGATDLEAATLLDLSAATVRRHLRLLAADNGASSRASAGALFETLGWN